MITTSTYYLNYYLTVKFINHTWLSIALILYVQYCYHTRLYDCLLLLFTIILLLCMAYLHALKVVILFFLQVC